MLSGNASEGWSYERIGALVMFVIGVLRSHRLRQVSSVFCADGEDGLCQL